MIDRTTHLQVPGRIADRHVEARARRLEAEARGTEHHAERTPWLTDRARRIRATAGVALAGVGRARVRSGPTLRPSSDRA